MRDETDEIVFMKRGSTKIKKVAEAITVSNNRTVMKNINKNKNKGRKATKNLADGDDGIGLLHLQNNITNNNGVIDKLPTILDGNILKGAERGDLRSLAKHARKHLSIIADKEVYYIYYIILYILYYVILKNIIII